MPPKRKEQIIRKEEETDEILGGVPLVGHGNRTLNEAAAVELKKAGINIITQNTHGGMITLGSLKHQHIHSDSARAHEYSKNSNEIRKSPAVELLKFQLRIFMKTMLKRYPNAKFFLTTQDMIGIEATKVTLGDKEFSVIMFLPDAMGKLYPGMELTDEHRKMAYLVWNKKAFDHIKDEMKLDAQLVKLVDPLKGFPKLTNKQVKAMGLLEIEKKENLCIFKLSGNGGDPKLIIAMINALWKNSGIESVVFPGKAHTKMNIALRQWIMGTRLNRKKIDTPKVNSSLDEAVFYNASRKMDHDTQLMILKPSEQVLHSLVLSDSGKNPNIVWLPPTGKQEVLNLVHYIALATDITSICIQKEFHKDLIAQLDKFELKQNIDYQLIEPQNLAREHFIKAPNWNDTDEHIPIAQAVQNIIDRS